VRAEIITEFLRRSPESGHAVEVEGLGTFRRSGRGYDFSPETEPQVFVAYVAEDMALARKVCESLRAAGCCPWLDKDRLMPGQDWPRSIERAIETADAFVACFTARSVAKRGQFQTELRYALDCARRMPLDHVFLIPARLEPCTVPRRISDHTQYVDLFPEWDRGMRRIIRTIRRSVPLRSRVELR
jgi:TIR domain